MADRQHLASNPAGSSAVAKTPPRLRAASLLIGLLLAAVAVVLIRESRGLLIGEGIRPETAQAIRSIALAQPGVRDVGRVLSMYVGPDDVLVTMDLDCCGEAPPKTVSFPTASETDARR